jgi:hypothetical protein
MLTYKYVNACQAYRLDEGKNLQLQSNPSAHCSPVEINRPPSSGLSLRHTTTEVND